MNVEKFKSVALDCLKKTFGYHEFRPLQEEIIETAMRGIDALVIMPTGGGKSLCFQIPALCTPGLTLVVSPLIALMNDQVMALKEQGIKAYALHSNTSSEEKRTIHHHLLNQDIDMLYLSPEKLMTDSFLKYLLAYQVDLIAIDEAHCISIWGNDFRPEYTKLDLLRNHFPEATLMALTATADNATQEDIVKQLNLKSPKKFLGSFERKNIFIEARQGIRRIEQIYEFLSQRPDDAGIIYCLSRKSTETISHKLNESGYQSAHYHAGMKAQDRNEIQRKFQHDELKIICATIAFGMGIDKSNIRFVIHYNMPKNIEGFYQEIGRAGRDGLPSTSLLFYSWADFMKLQKFITDNDTDEKFKEIQTNKLERMWEFASATSCRTNIILNYFDEYRSAGCQHCDNCFHPPKKIDGQKIAQKALSAIIRSGESLSLTILINMLRGSRRSDILRMQLDRIKTYGAGADLSFIQWKNYISQLINKGIIRIDYIDQFKLKTTPLSEPVLLGKEQINLVEFKMNEKSSIKTFKKKLKKDQFHEELVKKLKTWRTTKSRIVNLPPYVIFHDKTLEEIAREKPWLKSDLKKISGIGDSKFEKYGSEILNILQEFLSNQTILKSIKGQSLFKTYKLWSDGNSVEEIASKRELNSTTILTHLAHLYAQRDINHLDRIVSPKDLKAIEIAWQKSGYEASELSSIHQYLPNGFSFGILRCGLAIIQRKQEDEQNSHIIS